MKTILVVEDDRIYARTTANWLVKNGMDARYVLSVNSAKEFLSDHEVDLVLSDFRLGDCNGVELLEWMRVHGYRMPFLIMTGYGDIPGAVEAVKKGADNYLPNPYKQKKYLMSSVNCWNVGRKGEIRSRLFMSVKVHWQ